jgi:hypothetical protein
VVGRPLSVTFGDSHAEQSLPFRPPRPDAQYIILKHIRIVNKTASAATFSLYLGATGANVAGTEVIGLGSSVPANSYVDWYGALRMDAADFLVGGAGTTLALVIQGEGEVGVSG